LFLVDGTGFECAFALKRDPQTELRIRIRELAGSRVRYGYRRIAVLLRRQGVAGEREEGLSVQCYLYLRNNLLTMCPGRTMAYLGRLEGFELHSSL
jgi:hypothetical protein